ncbi:MAG TPA: hypothetical protein PKD90_16350 [Phnomibacter sp.]|nr:hypothetical protein [Phnomibacter sp.]
MAARPYAALAGSTPTSPILRPDYYTLNLPWSCRQEVKLEQVTRLPLRVRLGSLEVVNRLEGKH